MASTVEYALMAGGSYLSTRDKKNWFPPPAGWVEQIAKRKALSSGFEATTFINGNNVVISYAGTYDKDTWGDKLADAMLGAGEGHSQLLQAAEYYLSTKAANPGATITLTGHSLGGGLASLVAVLFGETAVTFDQAPFRNSANAVVATAVRAYLALSFPAASYPQIGAWLDPLDKFILSIDPLGQGLSQYGLAAREAKVSNTSVQGEFLSYTPALRIGTELQPLTHGGQASMMDLHSQALLVALKQNSTFQQMTTTLPSLLEQIFDKKLFSYSTDTSDPNLMDLLVRHQFGDIDGIPAGGD